MTTVADVASAGPALRSQLREATQRLADQYLAAPDPRRMLRERASLVDATLTRLFHAARLPDSVALVAVGGYGRGELCPGSDVDVLVLLREPADESTQACLERLIGEFWNLGLDVGHSVRTVAECLSEARGDITIETTLIEARHLAGNAATTAELLTRIRAQIDPRAFLAAKRLEQEARYLRYQETPYSLEPNCKESPGGLRDLQTIGWIAQACGYGRRWIDLEKQGLITHEELRHLRQCERLLQDLRIRLHLMARRREDRLIFDHQAALADQLAYRDTPEKRASEQMMQAYYCNAKTVVQLNTLILQNIAARLNPPEAERPPTPIDDRFQIVGTLLDIRDEQLFQDDPAAILESFLLMQEHDLLTGMSARTLRALWRARLLINEDFRRNPRHRAQFLKLLQNPRGIVHEFRRMNQYSILGRLLPAFGRIVGQMQHDLFHVYTVDQHILQVLRNLRRLTMEEFAHEYPRESQLINGFARHWLLYIAALFHDIAKGRGGDHSVLGMRDAREFCVNHGLSPEDTELVVWLVKEHLTMSQIAQKEDISDPNVITRFAERVGDLRRLTALYLLTVADIRGTSPKVWNGWKQRLLASLFETTRRRLVTGITPEPHGVIADRQAEAIRLLRYFALPDTVQEGLWKQLDTVYFLRHSGEEIAWHTRCLHYRMHEHQPVVKARIGRGEQAVAGTMQVMVYAPDQRDLFARMVGFFARNGFSILDAKIHTTAHGYALDSFVVEDIDDRENLRELTSYVEHELGSHLRSNAPIVEPPSGRLSRQVRHFPFPPKVTLRPDEQGKHFILNLVAADRPGLLFSIAKVLAAHRAELQTAKIATLGERIEDSFRISGGDLDQESQRIALERELIELLRI